MNPYAKRREIVAVELKSLIDSDYWKYISTPIRENILTMLAEYESAGMRDPGDSFDIGQRIPH